MDHKPYRPEDPQKGNLVFLSEDWRVDLSRPEEIAKRSGIIIERLNPDHKGNLFNYKIHVKMEDGTTIKSDSRSWKCLRQILSKAEKFVAIQKTLIKKLEAMAPKMDGPSME